MVPRVRERATRLRGCNFSSSSGKGVFQQYRPISAGRGQRVWLMRQSDLGYDTLLMAQRAILRTACLKSTSPNRLTRISILFQIDDEVGRRGEFRCLRYEE